MIRLLYGVDKNGYSEIRRYKILRENRWWYVLDTDRRDRIFKSKMRTEFEHFFLNEENARNALEAIRMKRGLPLLRGVKVEKGKRIFYE